MKIRLTEFQTRLRPYGHCVSILFQTLVWCLRNTMHSAARSFGQERGAPTAHIRNGSVREAQRSAWPKERPPRGLRRKWPADFVTRRLQPHEGDAPSACFVIRPFWAQQNASYFANTTLAWLLVTVLPAYAVSVMPEEMTEARQWVAARFAEAAPGNAPTTSERSRQSLTAFPPFSFVYGGRPAAELLKEWPLKRASREFSPEQPDRHERGRNLIEHTSTWTDPKTGLQVRCIAIEYQDFPTVEWTLSFRNTGSNDTPIVENIQALDIQLDRGHTGEFLLRHHMGSPANGSDYGPLESPLPPGQSKRIGASGGRSTNSDWSYFNLQCQDRGWILAVGWPGQWAAEFARDSARGLRIRAGQELTRFKLLPGEEVRGPLIVLQFYEGAWIRAQNLWRRWMMAHSMPMPGGRLPPPQFVASSSRQYDEMIKANETNQILFINRYLEEGLKLDYWWMDAGWPDFLLHSTESPIKPRLSRFRRATAADGVALRTTRPIPGSLAGRSCF